MTLDTSALIAVLFAEPGYRDLVDQILEADSVRVGAPTLVETSRVFAGRRGRPAGRHPEAVNATVQDLIDELGIVVVAFGAGDWRLAADAFARYGRGRHKAALNFGDCLAYATAVAAKDSLLFVGDDFRHTDVRPA